MRTCQWSDDDTGVACPRPATYTALCCGLTCDEHRCRFGGVPGERKLNAPSADPEAAAKAKGATEERKRALAAIDAEVTYQQALSPDASDYASCALEVLGRVRDHITKESNNE